MEREGRGRGENFVSRKRLNIVARSAAAISIVAAGAVVVEEFGSFDPLTNPVESANHLVLKDLHKSYEQLIDKLPEVEKAEATTSCDSGDTLVSSATAPNGNFLNVCNGGGTIEWTLYKSSKAVLNGPNTFFSSDGSVAKAGLYVTPDSAFLLLLNTSAGLNEALIYSSSGVLGSKTHFAVGSGGYILESVSGISANTFRIKACHTPTNTLYDNTFDSNGNLISGTTGGICGGSGVGGITELSDVEALPQNMTSGKNKDYTTPIAAGVAAATGAIAATGAALYIRKNRSAR